MAPPASSGSTPYTKELVEGFRWWKENRPELFYQALAQLLKVGEELTTTIVWQPIEDFDLSTSMDYMYLIRYKPETYPDVKADLESDGCLAAGLVDFANPSYVDTHRDIITHWAPRPSDPLAN